MTYDNYGGRDINILNIDDVVQSLLSLLLVLEKPLLSLTSTNALYNSKKLPFWIV